MKLKPARENSGLSSDHMLRVLNVRVEHSVHVNYR